jgi:hypothetical protein
MQRRKMFATAGVVSATAVAAAVALGANFGLFGLTGTNGGPGHFKLVDAKPKTPAEVTLVVDVPVPVTAAPPPTEGVVTTPRPAVTAASPTPAPVVQTAPPATVVDDPPGDDGPAGPEPSDSNEPAQGDDD